MKKVFTKKINIIKSYLLFFLIVFINFYCGSPKDQEIKLELMATIDTLKSQELEIDKFLYRANKITSQGDTLIIIDQIQDSIITFYNMANMELINAFGKIGDGPNEFTSISHFSIIDNGFAILDVNRMYYYRYLNDSIILDDIFDINPNYGPANNLVMLNEELFVVSTYGTPHMEYEHMLLSKNEMLSVFGDFPETEMPIESEIDKRNRSITYRKSGVCSENNQKFIMFYLQFPQAKIYDYNGKLLKNIAYYSNTENINPNLEERKLIFVMPYATDKYVYVLLLNDKIENIEGNINFKPDLLVLDWEGDIKARYTLDKGIVSFTIIEEENKLLGIDMGATESQKLQLYDLPKKLFN